MRVKDSLFCLWAAGLLISLCGASPPARADEPSVVQVPESVLRNIATKTAMPAYPESSKERGSKGVAVVQLRLNEEGVLSGLEVLQAPDDEIARAVNKAVWQWKFKTVNSNGKPCVLVGKLTFYFVIGEGGARVENPRKFKGLTAK